MTFFFCAFFIHFYFLSIKNAWVCPDIPSSTSKPSESYQSCQLITETYTTSWKLRKDNNNQPTWTENVFVPKPFTTNYLLLDIYDYDYTSDDWLGLLYWKLDGTGTDVDGTRIDNQQNSYLLSGKISYKLAVNLGEMSFELPVASGNIQQIMAHLAPDACVFPFMYKNIKYNGCTTAGSPNEPWCYGSGGGSNWYYCVKDAGSAEIVSTNIGS